MDNPLRILILEDNSADAEILQFELEEAGIVFTAEVVMTEADYIRELQTFSPDVILSDYDLPLYTGALALAEAKKHCPDVPFILVTGAVTEDRAIEILTSGAKDFVMKDRLHKIVPAIRRSLAEAEEHQARKRAEEELRVASRYARSLIEASLDPLVTISPDGKVMDVNRAAEEITGVSRDQIIGNDFANYFTQPEKARAGYERAFLNGSVKDYPLAIRHVSGRITDVLYNASTFVNERGDVQGVFAAARDVSEIKKAEESLRQSHRGLEDEVKRRTAALETEIEDRKKIEQALLESLRRERERATELEALLDAAPTPVFIAHDPDCASLSGNRAANDLLKIPHGSETSLSAPDERRPSHFRAMKNGCELMNEELPAQRAARGEEVRDFEFSLVFDDGTIRDVLGYGTPLCDEQGHPRGAVHVLVDITERKQMEEALRESEERHRLALEASSLGTFEVDLLSGKGRWNAIEFELLGLKPGEVPAGPDMFFHFVHPDDVEGLREDWAEAMRTGKLDTEFRIIRADGREAWLAGKGQFIFESKPAEENSETGRKPLRFMGVNFDITERKQAEEKARQLLASVTEEKERLKALINSVEDEIWFADTEKKFTLANPAALREFRLGVDDGIDVESFAASLEVYRPDGSTRPIEESPPLRALQGEVIKNEEEIIRTPASGELRYRQVSSSPVRDDGGRIVGSVSVVRDVTERKRSEYRWATTLASIGDAVIVTNNEGRITFINAAAEKLTGWPISEGMSKPGTTVFNIIDEHTRAKAEDPVARILREDTVISLADHTLLIRRDGGEVPIDSSGAPIKDKAGTTLGTVLIFRDITESKRVQAEITHLASFVMQNPNPVTEVDLAGTIRFMNPAAENLFPDLRRQGFAHPWLAGWADELAARTGESTRPRDREIRIGDKWFGQMICLTDDLQRIRIYGRSVTKRKQAEESLRKYTANLEMINRELESFSYSVSHDLRAPLRAIDGYSRMILRRAGSQFDEETRQQFNRVRDSIKTMGQLIDDLLALSQLSSHDLKGKMLDIGEIVEKTWQELKESNSDRKMILRIDGLPAAWGDGSLIKQVFVNILSNAIKFTRTRDQALIQAGGKEGDQEIVYWVKDNGVGFDMEYRDRMFNAFQRLHSSAEYEGTGIGLALVQRIIHRHNGRVWAEGKENEGASIYFTLPKKGITP